MLPLPTPPRKARKKAPAKRKPALSAEAIVGAALALLDEEGLENFSMRNLARRLKVYPTAIYWYVENRDALIREVINAVLVDLIPEDFDRNWQDGILGLCRNYRNRIKAHPNIAPLIGVQLASNVGVDFDFIERLLSGLQGAGFTGNQLRAAYNSVMGTMIGYTTQEFAMAPHDPSGDWARNIEATLHRVDARTYPVTAANLETMANRSFIMRWQNGSDAPLDDGFECFIQAQVKGLAQILAESRSTDAS